MEKIAIIIVAAGASTRMKEAKQLLPLGKTTMLGQVIKHAGASNADEVITVLGSNFNTIKAEVEEEKTKIIQNKNWEEGLGSSISTGMKWVVEQNNYSAVIILLADQPLIDTGYINLLIKTYKLNPEKIVATKYPKSLGVPVIFPATYFQELQALKDDEGAKELLKSNLKEIIPLNAANKTFDVDDKDDYEEILKIKYKF